MTNITNPVHGGAAYRYIECATPGCDWTLSVTQKSVERAVEQFEVALFRQPKRGRSLLGIARAHAAMGHPNVATEAYKKFLESWGAADDDRSELAEAESYVRRAEKLKDHLKDLRVKRWSLERKIEDLRS